MKFKDKSNARVLELAEHIAEVMEQEGRGFIFAPMVQHTGDHYTFIIVADRKENNAEETIVNFWATLASIVMNTNTQIPEDLMGEFRAGFEAFVKMVKEQAFPLTLRGDSSGGDNGR